MKTPLMALGHRRRGFVCLVPEAKASDVGLAVLFWTKGSTVQPPGWRSNWSQGEPPRAG